MKVIGREVRIDTRLPQGCATGRASLFIHHDSIFGTGTAALCRVGKRG